MDTVIRYTFKSYERLRKKKCISQLFAEGRWINHLYPLRLVYLLQHDPALRSHQVLFSIPKKKVRKAVDRNYIRRRMREAYRLHKHLLPRSSGSQGHFLLAYVYMANPGPVDYATLCSGVVTGINALGAQYEKCMGQQSLDKS